GVVVTAAQDDEVLRAAGEEQLAAGEEAEVAGPQERTLAILVILAMSQLRPERRGGLLRPFPVALGDARPGHPDLADPAGWAGERGVRIDDAYGLHRGAAAGQLPPPRRVSVRRHHPVGFEGRRVEREAPGLPLLPPAGHQQRRLGEAVAGAERRGAEAA